MQSLVVTIRALLLLAAAVVVPTMAIMGTPVLKRLRGESQAGEPTTAVSLQPPAAARPRVETVHRPVPAGSASSTATRRAPGAGPQVAAPGSTPWQSPAPISPAEAPFWTPKQTTAPIAEAPGGSRPAEPLSASEARDALERLQQRLKQLGAVYFRLEAFSASRFRFRCELPLPGNSRYNRHFEATDENPVAAMQRVVAEVESWRRRDGELARRPARGPGASRPDGV